MFMTVPKYLENFNTITTEERTKLSNSKVRGKALINTLNFLKTKFGNSDIESLINTLDIPTQIQLRKRIDENEWYQLHILIELNIHIANQYYKSEAAKLIEMGEFGGNTLMGTFMALKLKLTDIKSAAEFIKSQLEWYYMPASVQIITCESKHLNFECNELYDPSNTIIYRFAGIVKAILRIKGFEFIEVNIAKSDSREDSYTIQVIWA